MKTRIIIFSSSNSLKLAQAIQNKFYYKDYIPTIWNHNFFELSKPYIVNFEKLKTEYDYAILLCAKDDIICLDKIASGKNCPNKIKFTSRDNIWLEMGMCISKLSLNNTLIVKEHSVQLPSDLDGIEPIHFDYSESDCANIEEISSQIVSRITNHIEKNSSKVMRLSWEEYFMAFRKMIDKIFDDPDYGGFIFDAIIGISGGGLMVGDLLSREIKNHITPVLPLYADRRSKITNFNVDTPFISNKSIISLLENEVIQNILLVDSFTRNGITIKEAYNFLNEQLNNKNIKTAVVYVNEELLKDPSCYTPDYIGEELKLNNRKLMLEYNYMF